MPTYREFVLQSIASTQDFTFDQALRWAEAFECFAQGKAELRPLKKRAARLSKTLSELQQPAPPSARSSPLAELQPLVCNSTIEAALPSEPRDSVVGPCFASYRDDIFNTETYAMHAYRGWHKYRKLGADSTTEVFFSAVSPRKKSEGLLQIDRAEFETQSIQLTDIFTRMLCSNNAQERGYAVTFQRPRHDVRYSADSVEAIDPAQFTPDATYYRDGQQVAVFLPCEFWWKEMETFHQFIVWLVEQCQSQQLCYEVWQPGLTRNSPA